MKKLKKHLKCIVDGCENFRRANDLCNKHNLRMYHTGTTDPTARSHGSLEERFWRKVNKRGHDECWEWIGNKAPNGYGRIQEGGKGSSHLGAHRVSYKLHFGIIPDGLFVMHSCDNPGCVNPSHLSLGTPKENTADMIAKGRKRVVAPAGERHAKAKLTVADVRFIRSNPHFSHAALARHFGVGTTTVRNVRSGKNWQNVA
jgi:hypothetical protein